MKHRTWIAVLVLLGLATTAGCDTMEQIASGPKDVTIQVNAPLHLTLKQEFVVEVRVQNTAAESQRLDSIDVGDQPGHAYVVSQTKCAAAKGEIGGVQEKEGIGTEFHDVMGSNLSWHGIFVTTLAGGDKIHYSYKGTGTAKGGQFVSGSNTWTIFGGTGKFKGAKGEGSCKGKGNPDGTATWDCTGTYNVPAAAPAKKM